MAKKHGHGKFSMADGSYYEGQFNNGEICGHGFRYFASSRNTYAGEFQDGELHGQGVMRYADGSTYEGEWYRNKKEGYGILKSSDGSVYQGTFHDNKRHGQGNITFKNIESYDGDWVCDKRQGHGEWRAENGDIYVGQWQNDLYNGWGRLTQLTGATYEGMWVNGSPACAAVRLVITGVENPLNIKSGEPFGFCVECQTEDGQVMEDNGREIEVIAGVRLVDPAAAKSSAMIAKPSTSQMSKSSATSLRSSANKSHNAAGTTAGTKAGSTAGTTAGSTAASAASGSKLTVMDEFLTAIDSLTVINEDLAAEIESPEVDDKRGPEIVETPLGFSIIRYPLSTQQAADGTSLPSVSCRPPTTAITEEPEDGVSSFEVLEAISETSVQQQPSMHAPGTPLMSASVSVFGGPSQSLVCTAGGSVPDYQLTELSTKSITLAPVATALTTAGRVAFNHLVLPAVEQSDTATDSSGMVSTTSLLPVKIVEPTASLHIFAQPGEYVVLARDVTFPPFLGIQLQPAALVVTVIPDVTVSKLRSSSSKLSTNKSPSAKSTTSVKSAASASVNKSTLSAKPPNK